MIIIINEYKIYLYKHFIIKIFLETLISITFIYLHVDLFIIRANKNFMTVKIAREIELNYKLLY